MLAALNLKCKVISFVKIEIAGRITIENKLFVSSRYIRFDKKKFYKVHLEISTQIEHVSFTLRYAAIIRDNFTRQYIILTLILCKVIR